MTKQKSLDPRVIRTRKLLRDALVELIQERGFETIKVRDITERATLNRATFYLHYRDKHDLLIKGMYELMAGLENEVGLMLLQNDKLTKDSMLEIFTQGLNYFAKHKTFVRVMLCEVGVPSINVIIQNYIENLAVRWLTMLKVNQNKDRFEIDFIIKYSSTAYIGVIKWWLENDMPYTAKFMSEQFVDILSEGFFRSLGIDSLT